MRNDRRTDEQRKATTCYVNATDSFMSGWGEAPALSYFCVACPDLETANEIEWRMDRRDEFKRVAISSNPRTGGGGCHTSIIWHKSFTWQPQSSYRSTT